MSQKNPETLSGLFRNWSGQDVRSISRLPASGSSREYYRITGPAQTAIGAFNADREENEAFIYLSRHFQALSLPVPRIYLTDLDRHVYLLEDLGQTTLYDHLVRVRENGKFPSSLEEIYLSVLSRLQQFQIDASEGLDYSVCYPRSSFDRQSMQWDLSYFKYYFLKLAGVPFHEQRLEDDYRTLIDFLLERETDYFLYRDFQSANIMLRNGAPYFIDYQGGRRGALAYDVASLLFDSKANIPPEARGRLLDHYIRELDRYPRVDKSAFRESYYGYVLIRIMQAMGAYGYRGFYEKKYRFLRSIPFALDDLKWITEHVELPVRLPTLYDVFGRLLTSRALKRFRIEPGSTSTLTVSIHSFSYRHGIPEDPGGHGGGYVFDCRGITNPGKEEPFRDLTGKDAEVVSYLERQADVNEFLGDAISLVDMSVHSYEEKNYTRLMVCFGCTGGQHRSVFCAEKLAEHLRRFRSVRITLRHRELD